VFHYNNNTLRDRSQSRVLLFFHVPIAYKKRRILMRIAAMLADMKGGVGVVWEDGTSAVYALSPGLALELDDKLLEGTDVSLEEFLVAGTEGEPLEELNEILDEAGVDEDEVDEEEEYVDVRGAGVLDKWDKRGVEPLDWEDRFYAFHPHLNPKLVGKY